MQVAYTLHHFIDLRLQYSAKKKLLTAEPSAKTVVGLLMWQSGALSDTYEFVRLR